MELIFSLDTIKETAAEFWKITGDINVIALHGEMGAGKTTFVHALCEIKGVKDAVTSPTFSIINEYTYTANGASRKIFHIDLYRLKDEEEATQAGIADCLYSDVICFVEWPEKAPGILPANTLHAFLKVIDSANRKLGIGYK